MQEIDQVAQVAPKPVQLPSNQHVALTQRLEANIQAGMVVTLAGDMILVKLALGMQCGAIQQSMTYPGTS